MGTMTSLRLGGRQGAVFAVSLLAAALLLRVKVAIESQGLAYGAF
jgi:hypothetical protein